MMKKGIFKVCFHFFLMAMIVWGGSPLLSKEISAARPDHHYIEDLLLKMTPEEKIGQLLMVGISGNKLLPRTKHLIKDLKLGGIILYSHNVQDPKQIRSFVRDLQQTGMFYTKIPLFISIDQEGGAVSRIRTHAQVLPAAMAIGATRSPQFSFLAGKVTGIALSSMGINMNLAPVLDVNTEEDNHVIGVRSFGDDMELVSQMGMWYIEGLQSKGVVATAKHFPGHGNTSKDSHYLMPVLDKEINQLESFQIMPFQRAVMGGLDAIMTAHISVPALDPSGLPATLSYNLLTNLVRKKMNFRGIVITDDLEMKSIGKRYEIGKAALKAVLAGSDIVMIGWTDTKKREVYEALLSAYRDGTLSEERLTQSVKRILALKLKRGFFASDRKPAQGSLKYLDHPIHQKLALQIAMNAITMVKNQNQVLPLRQDDPRRVLLVTPLRRFYNELRFFHEHVTPYEIPNRPTVAQMRQLVLAIQKRAKASDLLIFGVTDHSQVGIINEISQKVHQPVIVVSFGSPYYLNKLSPRISATLCSYGSQKELVHATVKVLTGLIHPTGKLPVMIGSNVLSPNNQEIQKLSAK